MNTLTAFAALTLMASISHADAEPTIPELLKLKNKGPTTISLRDITLYASEGYRLRFRYKDAEGITTTVLDTTRPSITIEESEDGSQVLYRTLLSNDSVVTFESVNREDARGACFESYKTSYQWLAKLPEQAIIGGQVQRIAAVKDYDYERPCGVSDESQAPFESVINVKYTLLGPTRYNYGDINIRNCVKLAEQAPDYSGFTVLCPGVGAAYRLRTGSTFGKRERRLVEIIDQPAR